MDIEAVALEGVSTVAQSPVLKKNADIPGRTLDGIFLSVEIKVKRWIVCLKTTPGSPILSSEPFYGTLSLVQYQLKSLVFFSTNEAFFHT